MPYKDIEKRREVKRNYMRKIYATQPEKSAEWQKTWRDNNPERVKELSRERKMIRRARIKAARVGKVSLKKLKESWNGMCGICTKPVEGLYHVDHIMPLSKGGEHSQTNLQITHPLCNLLKGNKV